MGHNGGVLAVDVVIDGIVDINVLALREDGMWGMIKVGGVWGGVGGLWGDGWGCYVYYRLQYLF